MTLRLDGRRALVTGAASGIGLATADRLSAEGAAVVYADVRSEALDTLRSGRYPAPHTLTCDVGVEEQVEATVSRCAEILGGLDTIVTCAGVVGSDATHLLSLDRWEQIIRINLTGTFLVLKHAIPYLIAAGGGSITTVGSVASIVAAGRNSAYDASKGGVLQLTRAIGVEYVASGIRANCVLPGVVSTSLAATSSELYGPVDMQASNSPALRLKIPMERAADPKEIAGVIAFLASDDASFVTGAAIAADGGYTAI